MELYLSTDNVSMKQKYLLHVSAISTASSIHSIRDIVCALAALFVDDHGTCLLVVQLCDMLVLLEHHLQIKKWMNYIQKQMTSDETVHSSQCASLQALNSVLHEMPLIVCNRHTLDRMAAPIQEEYLSVCSGM